MGYRMLGDTLPAVEIKLWAGETMYTQSGGMAWMSNGSTLDSNVKGGLIRGLGRMLSDESLFMATCMASRLDSTIASVSIVPGKTLVIDTTKISLIYQKRTFLCAQTTVEINTVLTRKFTTEFFGGESFIFQQIQGSGVTSLEVDGDVAERVLAPGEAVKADAGDVLAFEPGVSYEIEIAKGVKNILLSGEGLFLTKLTDSDKVYMQIMNIAEFTGWTAQGLPTSR